MRTPGDVLAATDWAALEHAFGEASDVLPTLSDLLSEDEERCAAALADLDVAVLHQGSIYSVTAPVAEFVAGILDDPRTLLVSGSTLPWDGRQRPLRAGLIEWLGQVAASAAFGEDGPGHDQDGPSGSEPVVDPAGAATLACRRLRPDLFTAVAPFLTDPDPPLRTAALGAAAHLLRAPGLAESVVRNTAFGAAARSVGSPGRVAHRDPLARSLLRSVTDGDEVERTAAVLTLAALDVAPRALLVDEDPTVRAIAASVPALDEDPVALDEVRRALQEDPGLPDNGFLRLPGEMWGLPRFTLVAALLRRTTDFVEIIDQACAVARMTNRFMVDSDWGPLLVRAFPDGDGIVATSAQQRFLSEIVDNNDCWFRGVPSCVDWTSRAGLPADRDDLAALVTAAGQALG